MSQRWGCYFEWDNEGRFLSRKDPKQEGLQSLTRLVSIPQELRFIEYLEPNPNTFLVNFQSKKTPGSTACHPSFSAFSPKYI